jgi:glycosyltransferase involved in cell wall biosynthesis
MPLVSISNSQRRPMPANMSWQATINHGLPETLVPFSKDGGEYLAFLGRISPEKRPDRAIEIATAAGLPLKIAAKVDPVDKDYFEQRIAPLLDHPLVDFIGEISEHQKAAFLGKAKALLFPIDWPEPFGLVMIEAMSAGTPVIAWRHGSVPEIIQHGVTGYVVDSIEAAVAATRQIDRLDRTTVRNCFIERFTAERMARAYEGVYDKLLMQRPAKHASHPAVHASDSDPYRSADAM